MWNRNVGSLTLGHYWKTFSHRDQVTSKLWSWIPMVIPVFGVSYMTTADSPINSWTLGCPGVCCKQQKWSNPQMWTDLWKIDEMRSISYTFLLTFCLNFLPIYRWQIDYYQILLHCYLQPESSIWSYYLITSQVTQWALLWTWFWMPACVSSLISSILC